MTQPPLQQPLGVILAGGQARRMGGGDKALVRLGGRSLLDHVAGRIGPQVARLALNANGDAARFVGAGLPVLPDPVVGYPGPLAGVLAALDWAVAAGVPHVVTVACDTPFLPCDLVPRLILAADGGPAVAGSGGRLHPTAALWPVALRAPLARALAEGEARVGHWAMAQGAAVAEFAPGPPDPFLNLNTPADLAAAEGRL